MNQDGRSILGSVESAASRLDRGWQDPQRAPGTVRPVTETAAHGTPEIHWRRPYLPFVLLSVALTAAAASVAWLLLRSDGGTPGIPAANGIPALVSQLQLQRLAASVDHPVYWAGPRPGFSYELTRTSMGRVFVRYLPHGVAAGDARPDFLTVGTYPGKRSFADLKRAANRDGAVWVGLDHGGLVVFAARNARSAYLGYPSGKYQVEVFAPSTGVARKLVLAGTIVPVT
jgi:hypothetical protein